MKLSLSRLLFFPFFYIVMEIQSLLYILSYISKALKSKNELLKALYMIEAKTILKERKEIYLGYLEGKEADEVIKI